MGKYRAYPEYKDSGIDWLGEVPSHWVVSSLRFLIDSIRNGSTSTQVEQSNLTVPISRIESISTGEINSDKVGFVNERTIDSSYQLNQGDILMSHINSLAMVGNLAIKRDNSVLYHGMNLLRLTPNLSRVSSGYLYWLLKSGYSRQSIESLAKPAINQASVSTESLKSLRLLLPDSSEQTQIANFLDHETAKIDTLIEKQQQLIKLLKEKRQAVISHAVTKGLNSQAPMKDSGVEWLGEVPEHWQVSRLKWVIRIAGRIGYRGYTVDDIVDEDEGAIVLSPSNINDRGFSLEKKTFLSWNKYYESPEIMVESGDILLAKTSWSFGKVAVISDVYSPMTINPQMVLLKQAKLDPYYLWSLLSTDALQCLIFNANSGSYMPTMTQESIGNLPVLIPPYREVSEIVEYLKDKTKAIDLLIDKQKEVIALLKERRTALISAAVTGKIDVRNWQAPTSQDKALEQTA